MNLTKASTNSEIICRPGCRTNLKSKRTARSEVLRGYLRTAAAASFLLLLTTVAAIAQNAPASEQKPERKSDQKPEQKTLMAEDAFKNVQVLRGIPVSEFMEEMGFFSAALTANCTTCHGGDSAGSWAAYAVDTPMKQTARKMVLMMNSINQSYFGGKREVTCYSCHNGNDRPRVTPSIADVYRADAQDEEPDQLLPEAPGQPSADQILDKYIEAVGGARNLAKLTSYAAMGTSQGYAETAYPIEVYAKAPYQLSTITHTDTGDRGTIFSGSGGWVLAPPDDKPITVLPLAGGDLIGAKLDAVIAFPAGMKEALTKWRVSYPSTIDDKSVQVVQGTIDGRTPINLYFDQATGLLVRQVRYTDTKLGLYSTQVDYSDYRDVAGVKIPFHYTSSWLDGRSIVELKSVQPNVAIPESKFSKPAAPAGGKPTTR